MRRGFLRREVEREGAAISELRATYNQLTGNPAEADELFHQSEVVSRTKSINIASLYQENRKAIGSFCLNKTNLEKLYVSGKALKNTLANHCLEHNTKFCIMPGGAKVRMAVSDDTKENYATELTWPRFCALVAHHCIVQQIQPPVSSLYAGYVANSEVMEANASLAICNILAVPGAGFLPKLFENQKSEYWVYAVATCLLLDYSATCRIHGDKFPMNDYISDMCNGSNENQYSCISAAIRQNPSLLDPLFDSKNLGMKKLFKIIIDSHVFVGTGHTARNRTIAVGRKFAEILGVGDQGYEEDFEDPRDVRTHQAKDKVAAFNAPAATSFLRPNAPGYYPSQGGSHQQGPHSQVSHTSSYTGQYNSAAYHSNAPQNPTGSFPVPNARAAESKHDHHGMGGSIDSVNEAAHTSTIFNQP